MPTFHLRSLPTNSVGSSLLRRMLPGYYMLEGGKEEAGIFVPFGY